MDQQIIGLKWQTSRYVEKHKYVFNVNDVMFSVYVNTQLEIRKRNWKYVTNEVTIDSSYIWYFH
jgi:hypothetical protein